MHILVTRLGICFPRRVSKFLCFLLLKANGTEIDTGVWDPLLFLLFFNHPPLQNRYPDYTLLSSDPGMLSLVASGGPPNVTSQLMDRGDRTWGLKLPLAPDGGRKG